MDIPVTAAASLLPPGLQPGKAGLRDGEIHETVPDQGYRLLGRMHQVFGIETVVAELVQQDLIGRKVLAPFRGGVADIFDGKDQDALAQLVPMRSVLQVTDRGDREYEFLP